MLNVPRTFVGNEFVHGASGDEHKRVSVVEMMATRAPVKSWDNSARGLDTSTVLDSVKGLGITTDILDHGRRVYFAPPSDAQAYFEDFGFRSLPRQNTPGYLVRCAGLHTTVRSRKVTPRRPFHPRSFGDGLSNFKSLQDADEWFGRLREGRGRREGPGSIPGYCHGGHEGRSGEEESSYPRIRRTGQGSHCSPVLGGASGRVPDCIELSAQPLGRVRCRDRLT